MFSMKTIYALRSLQYLAEKYNKGNVLIGEISENEKIPKKFLENILLILKKEGFLISKTGKGGGYSLAASPEQISLADVIISLEGSIALIPCAEGSEGAYKCEHCEDHSTCGTSIVMQDVSEKLAELLKNKTAADLAEEAEKARQKSSGSYDYMI